MLAFRRAPCYERTTSPFSAMKSPFLVFPIALAAGCLASGQTLLAQTTVVFANRVTSSPCGTIDAPIYGPQAGCPQEMLRGQGTNQGGSIHYTGQLLSGTGFTAALFGGPVGSAEGSLTLVGQTTFRTGALAGYLVPSTLPLPANAGTFQVRAWDNKGGTLASWAQVVADPTVPRGASALFTPICPSPPLEQPLYLQGLTSFNLFLTGGPTFGLASFTTNVVVAPGGTATLEAQVVVCPPGVVVTQSWAALPAGSPVLTNRLVLPGVNYQTARNYRFRVEDSLGNFLVRTARVQVLPRLSNITKPSALTAALNYHSAPGSTVSVQFATAVGVGGWATLGAATSGNTNGVFNDLGASNSSRFYRLRLEP